MAKKTKAITVSFTKSKETKGTFVYAEDADEGEEIIPTLYVKKSASKLFGGSLPDELTITIE